QEGSPGYDAAASAGAFLPIVHVVLLEGTGRAKPTDASEPDRFLDMRRRGLVGKNPGPNRGLIGAPRLPDAESARGGAQHREIGEHRADNRVDETRSRPETLFELGPDLFFVFEHLGHRRVAHIVRPDADQDMAVARGNHAPGGLRLRRDTRAEGGFDGREMAPR